jgi:hypothetical protein
MLTRLFRRCALSWLIIHPGLSLARICTALRHAAPLKSHKGGMVAPLLG